MVKTVYCNEFSDKLKLFKRFKVSTCVLQKDLVGDSYTFWVNVYKSVSEFEDPQKSFELFIKKV